MKLLKLVCRPIDGPAFSPSFKCGDGDWLGGLIAAGGAVTAAGANALGSIYSNNKQMTMSNDQLLFNQQWQNYWNERALEFQREESEKARKWQSEEWKSQFAKQNEYSTPASQVERLRAAGINPAAVFGSVGSSGGSSPSTPIASTPSAPAHQSMPGNYQPTLFNPFGSFGSALRDVAGAFKDLAEADKTGVDTEYLRRTLNARVAQQETAADFQNLEFKLRDKYGDAFEKAKCDKYLAEANDAAQRAINAAKEGSIIDIKAEFAREMAELDKRYKTASTLVQESEANYIDRILSARLANIQSDTHEHYASAALKRSGIAVNQATVENLNSQTKLNKQTLNLRAPDEITSQEFVNQYNTTQGKAAIYSMVASKIDADSTIAAKDAQEAKNELKRAIYESDLVGLRMTMELCEDALGIVLPIKKAKALSNIAEAAQSNSDRKQQQLEVDKDHFENYYKYEDERKGRTSSGQPYTVRRSTNARHKR